MPENKPLYSKYHVRTPDEKPLSSETFVLQPFHSDGSIRDSAAIEALQRYAEHVSLECPGLAESLAIWINNPGGNVATKTLNIPE